jgi:hypothetical protein
VFRVENTNLNAPPVNNNDEITLYVSSNEAVLHIFGFPIHERYPVVLHLAIHFENGQHVYFMSKTAFDCSINPPKTTLTKFFELCNILLQILLIIWHRQYFIQKYHDISHEL